MARLMRGFAQAALENNLLWHERDISNSSVERIILPDATTLLDYMLHRMTGILRDMRVYPERMLRNLELTGGLVFSEEVLLALVESGLSREDAYSKVQRHAMAAWERPPSFYERVTQDEEILERVGRERLLECFSLVKALKSVDFIFNRLGLII